MGCGNSKVLPSDAELGSQNVKELEEARELQRREVDALKKELEEAQEFQREVELSCWTTRP